MDAKQMLRHIQVHLVVIVSLLITFCGFLFVQFSPWDHLPYEVLYRKSIFVGFFLLLMVIINGLGSFLMKPFLNPTMILVSDILHMICIVHLLYGACALVGLYVFNFFVESDVSFFFLPSVMFWTGSIILTGMLFKKIYKFLCVEIAANVVDREE